MEEELASFDWGFFLGSHLNTVTNTGTEMRVCCPFCSETSGKLYFNQKKVAYTCFKCDRSGSLKSPRKLLDLVAATLGSSVSTAAEVVASRSSKIPRDWDDLLQEENRVPPKVEDFSVVDLPPGSHDLTTQETDYLLNRGVSTRELGFFKGMPHYESPLVYVKVYSGSVDNPILGSWQGRHIGPSSVKYRSAPHSKIHNFLWPFVPSVSGVVVFVEGVYDAIAFRRAGVEAYSTFGKKLSHDQLIVAQHLGAKEVVFAWDARDAMQDINKYAKVACSVFEKVSILDFSSLPKDKDLGDSLTDADLLLNFKRSYDDRKEYGSWDWMIMMSL